MNFEDKIFNATICISILLFTIVVLIIVKENTTANSQMHIAAIYGKFCVSDISGEVRKTKCYKVTEEKL